MESGQTERVGMLCGCSLDYSLRDKSAAILERMDISECCVGHRFFNEFVSLRPRCAVAEPTAPGQVLGIVLITSRKSRRFPSSRVPIAHIALPLITRLTSLRRCKFSDKGVEALHKI